MILQHDVILESEEHFDGRLPTHHLGFLLADLPVAIRGAVSMALRNRSKAPGKQPAWLRRASDVRFVGHSGNGITNLRLELPSLGEAAHEVYEQQTLFEIGRPDTGLTGLDLLSHVLNDIDAGRADSNAFDPQLLKQVGKFKRFFVASPFKGFRLSGSTADRNSVKVTAETIENSQRLYGKTPTPQRARIVGSLDGLEASTQRFSLLLDSGERVLGVYPEELTDALQPLWRTRVLVLGTSVFRASGNLLRIEADSIQPGETASSLFSAAPVPSATRLDPNKLRKNQGPRSGMAAIMGRWPGTETDSEIESALESLS
ncbi:MAG: hypothetical protein U0892_13840 [Pirellulales bacterium]